MDGIILSSPASKDQMRPLYYGMGSLSSRKYVSDWLLNVTLPLRTFCMVSCILLTYSCIGMPGSFVTVINSKYN